MNTLDDFGRELRNALAHLHDPAFQPSARLCDVIGCDPVGGLTAVQSEIIRMIESIEPGPRISRNSRVWRDYDVLQQRFILGLSQEETAEQLNLSVRSLQRAQQEATQTLVRRFWERYEARAHPAAGEARPVAANAPLPDPILQVREELLSLQRNYPDAECELGAVVNTALKAARASAQERGIALQAQPQPADIRLACHPSVLCQALLTVIRQLSQALPPGGSIDLTSECLEGRIRLTITGAPLTGGQGIALSLVSELLGSQGASITPNLEGGAASFAFDLPLAVRVEQTIKVLVVDDNDALVALFQTYCIWTPYEIVHVKEGKRIAEAIAAVKPQIIVLDLMLPDFDGWDVLMNLHMAPETRSIPIIVCSVIRDEQLALTLGAALCLRKPVWRQQLLDAMNQVLPNR